MINSIKRYLLCALGGLFYCLGYPSFLGTEIAVLPLIGTTFLFYFLFLKGDSKKKKWLSLFFFLIAFNFGGYYWIPKTLQVFGDLPVLVSYLASILSSLIILPQFIVFLLTQKYWEKLYLKFLKKLPLIEFEIFFYTAVFLLLENTVPQQFPSHLGHSWVSYSQYLGLAPLFGVPIFSAISYLLLFSVLFSFSRKKHSYFCYFIALFFLLLNPLLVPSKSQKTKELPIRISQASIGNYLKLESESGDLNSIEKIMMFFEELAYQPYQVGSYQNPELIMWSETSYPYSISSKALFSKQFYPPLTFQNIISKTGSEFLTGGYDQRSNSLNHFERDYNAVFFFNNQSELKDVYHKMKLIPFGETLPFGPLNKILSQLVPNIAFFSVGEEFTLFRTKSHISFITPICYELLYADFIREYLNHNDEQAQFIANLTNDSWYEDPEPRQHLYLTRWRAIEFNIPIVRSTNTGFTTLILPDGTLGPTLDRNKRENLDFVLKVSQKREKTLYQRWGLWGTWLLLTLLLVLRFIFWKGQSLLLKDREA